MLTGKTLPCFAAFDGGARSGGFIGDRFLSGQQPRETCSSHGSASSSGAGKHEPAHICHITSPIRS